MAARKKRPDKFLLVSTVLLVLAGLIIFTSASLSLMARSGVSIGSVIFSQLVLGLLFGIAFGYLAYRIDLNRLRKAAFWILLGSVVVACLVFVPDLGLEHAGARRWIVILGFSFQPVELVKISLILFLSSWLASAKKEVGTFRYGFLPFVVILVIVSALILAQPDNGSFLVIVTSAVAVFLVAGGRWKHLAFIALLCLLGMSAIVASKPYVLDRITTFINPASDPLGSSYQIQQSLTAIGSGEIIGRGFGQSIQKFQYLPEPVGDSIFAVVGEEFGFVGASLLVLLYLVFGLRGMRVASRARDDFSRLLITGVVVMILVQSYFNIAAMLGLMPLTGIPLVFVSHGGTALMFALISVGLVLNASRK